MNSPLRQLILVVGFFTSWNTIHAKTKVEVLFIDHFPPYSYVDSISGQHEGIYFAILKRAFARLPDYNVTIKPISWNQGLKLIESGKSFAIVPPYFRSVERPYIWPYSLPLLDERLAVFCRKEIFAKSPRNNWPLDYVGLKVGINTGFATLATKEMRALVKKAKIKVIESQSSIENITKTVSGALDCYANDRISILWEIKKLKRAKKYPQRPGAQLVEGATIAVEQVFVGYSAKGKFSFGEDFIKKLDTVLYEMRRQEEMDQMIEEFLL